MFVLDIIVDGEILSVIYGLYDPENQIVRYVGQTVSPKKRLKDHVSEANCNIRFNRKNNWIRSVLKEGRRPEMMILEEVEDHNQEALDRAERFHIAQLLDCGFDLTNATDGGSETWRVAEETVKHLKSRPRKPVSEETKAKMSRSQKERIANDPLARQRMRQAWFDSPNTRPPVHSYGEDVKGAKLTYDAVASIRKRMRGGESLASVCEDYPKISKVTIQKAAVGRSWPHVKEEPYKASVVKKLTDEDVERIKELCKTQSQSEVAIMFDVCPSHVSNIVNNKRRKPEKAFHKEVML